jgi:hypothetical protein
MSSRKTIYLSFIAVALIASTALAAENAATDASVPTKNLPEGFSLLAVKTASTPGVNMTEEIEDFYGAEAIGQTSAVIGIYTWAPLGVGYDSKITLLFLQDPAHARAAASNFLSNFRANNAVQLPGNVSLINPATINGHEVLEIGDLIENKDIRFMYLWNNESTVILAEGNSDRNASMQLASATGL